MHSRGLYIILLGIVSWSFHGGLVVGGRVLATFFWLGRGYRMRFLWSDRNTVAMSKSNASLCILCVSATVLSCLTWWWYGTHSHTE
jgi:hypothetical protein